MELKREYVRGVDKRKKSGCEVVEIIKEENAMKRNNERSKRKGKREKRNKEVKNVLEWSRRRWIR